MTSAEARQLVASLRASLAHQLEKSKNARDSIPPYGAAFLERIQRQRAEDHRPPHHALVAHCEALEAAIATLDAFHVPSLGSWW